MAILNRFQGRLEVARRRRALLHRVGTPRTPTFLAELFGSHGSVFPDPFRIAMVPLLAFRCPDAPMPASPDPRHTDVAGLRPAIGSPPVEWVVADGRAPYLEAVAAMESYVARMVAGAVPERVWLVEHPPLYTAGTSARDADLRAARFPVHGTGRGGQYTYHGPGQRVAYAMLDLNRRRRDVRAFVAALESWIIGALARMNVRGERREDRVGVWVARPDKAPGLDGSPAEDKIAAIGIRLRRWVSYHGIAVNVDSDLDHFGGIVPCGIASSQHGVTSLVDLGHTISMSEFDVLLRRAFEDVFGPTASAG